MVGINQNSVKERDVSSLQPPNTACCQKWHECPIWWSIDQSGVGSGIPRFPGINWSWLRCSSCAVLLRAHPHSTLLTRSKDWNCCNGFLWFCLECHWIFRLIRPEKTRRLQLWMLRWQLWKRIEKIAWREYNNWNQNLHTWRRIGRRTCYTASRRRRIW